MTAVFINAFFDCFINALLEHELEVYDLGILNGRFGVEARIEVGVFRLPRAAEMASTPSRKAEARPREPEVVK
jgi:hypothetical protein